MKIKHLLYMPLLGLGLYNGHRGGYWLRSRIKILKQFVVLALQNQTNKDFVLWISVRYIDKADKQIKELKDYFNSIKEFQTVFTYSGVCFWDDKYPDIVARDRLLTALHGSISGLLDVIGEADYVLMQIQPSDDIYIKHCIQGIQNIFKEVPKLQAVGFSSGYIMDYFTKELAEYNPTTNPPFVAIKFSRDVFIDPLKHIDWTAIKRDVGKYKAGTPCPSHEYYPDVFNKNYKTITERGFLVGTHSANISTCFNHPFKGRRIEGEEKRKVLEDFNLYSTDCLKLEFSPKNWILKKMPNIRTKIYNWLRN